MNSLLRCLLLCVVALSTAVAAGSKCTFAADVFFDQGSATLDQLGAQRAIHPIDVVQSSNTVLQYIVVGHADKSEGAHGDANLLSLARAGVVAAQVLRSHPELKGVMYIEGKSFTQPVSTEPQKNRRVEIEVLCIVPPTNVDRTKGISLER